MKFIGITETYDPCFVPDLDMGASFEYHGRKCTGAATPMKYAFKDAQGN